MNMYVKQLKSAVDESEINVSIPSVRKSLTVV